MSKKHKSVLTKLERPLAAADQELQAATDYLANAEHHASNLEAEFKLALASKTELETKLADVTEDRTALDKQLADQLALSKQLEQALNEAKADLHKAQIRHQVAEEYLSTIREAEQTLQDIALLNVDQFERALKRRTLYKYLALLPLALSVIFGGYAYVTGLQWLPDPGDVPKALDVFLIIVSLYATVQGFALKGLIAEESRSEKCLEGLNLILLLLPPMLMLLFMFKEVAS